MRACMSPYGSAKSQQAAAYKQSILRTPTICRHGHPRGGVTLVTVAGAAVWVLAADKQLHHMVPDRAVCIQ